MGMFGYTRDELIAELRAENKRLREDPKKKHYCVVCDRRCKRYKRQLHDMPARFLIALFLLTRDSTQDTFHYTAIRKRGRLPVGGASAMDMLQGYDLAHFTERGWWYITEKGKAFVLRTLRIEKWAFVYNKKVEAFDDSQGTISIDESLGIKFDYWELMNR